MCACIHLKGIVCIKKSASNIVSLFSPEENYSLMQMECKNENDTSVLALKKKLRNSLQVVAHIFHNSRLNELLVQEAFYDNYICCKYFYHLWLLNCVLSSHPYLH